MEQQVPRAGSQWTHNKSGNVYTVVESFPMEHPDLGVWMPCVVYTRNGQKFARSLSNFLLKFTEVEWG